MMQGLTKFADYFEDHKHQYTIIGGAACFILMEDAGVDFRATKDIDMVVSAEVKDAAFVQYFWDFCR